MAVATVIVKDTGWQRLRDLARELRGQKSFAKVGVLENAAPPEDGRFTMASLAAIQEFGSRDGRIPARPWVSGGIRAGEERLTTAAQKLAKGVYEGKVDTEYALNVLGAMGAAEIRRYVTQGEQVPPPNAPATLRAKLKKGRWNEKNLGPVNAAKLVRTLVDTGRMIGSVTWAVVVQGKQTSIEAPPGAAGAR